mgnify:CR=1 FL=1
MGKVYVLCEENILFRNWNFYSWKPPTYILVPHTCEWTFYCSGQENKNNDFLWYSSFYVFLWFLFYLIYRVNILDRVVYLTASILKSHSVRCWNQSIMSNVGKVSWSIKQWEPLMGFTVTLHRRPQSMNEFVYNVGNYPSIAIININKIHVI